MATISFTKNMKLNDDETKTLFKILNSKSKNSYKVKNPAATAVPNEVLNKMFKKKETSIFSGNLQTNYHKT